MKNNQSFVDGLQVYWDATSLELAQTCLRKYYYAMIEQIAPEEKSVHLIFGGIYAKALEHFYKYRAAGDDYDAALCKVVREALNASWDRENEKPIFFNDTKKTRVALIRTIVWYLEQFGHETDEGLKTYHLSDGKPAVELSFAIEIDQDFVYCGHLDRVCWMGDDLYVLDQKTTGSSLTNYYFNQFDTSLQMTGYSFAGKATLQSPIRGVIIDAAQINVNSTVFGRKITTRTPDQIEDWVNSMRHTIESVWRATETGYWPLNYSSCEKYGGCPYRVLCTTSKKLRKNYIKTDFKKKVWDPIVER